MSPEDFIRTYGITMQATRRNPFPDPDGNWLLVGWDVTLTHNFAGPPASFDPLNYTTDVAVTALSLPHVLLELANVASVGGMDYDVACASAEWDNTTDNRRIWRLWGTERHRMHTWWIGDPVMWQDFLSLADNK